MGLLAGLALGCLDDRPQMSGSSRLSHNQLLTYSSFVGDAYSEWISGHATSGGTCSAARGPTDWRDFVWEL
jgi:hypothetical protein